MLDKLVAEKKEQIINQVAEKIHNLMVKRVWSKEYYLLKDLNKGQFVYRKQEAIRLPHELRITTDNYLYLKDKDVLKKDLSLYTAENLKSIILFIKSEISVLEKNLLNYAEKELKEYEDLLLLFDEDNDDEDFEEEYTDKNNDEDDE